MKIKEFFLQDVSWSKLKENLSYSFTQNANQFCGKHHVALRTFLTLLFTFIVFWQSWTTDDAYHSYIMARHLAEGKGLVSLLSHNFLEQRKLRTHNGFRHLGHEIIVENFV